MVPDANGAFHTLSACHYGKRGAQRILMILRHPRGLENQASPRVITIFSGGGMTLGQVPRAPHGVFVILDHVTCTTARYKDILKIMKIVFELH